MNLDTFYSAVMQSMAALLALGGIFTIYRLEYITKQLKLTYEAFKNFIRFYFIEANTRIYVNQPNFVNGDTAMWLDKDVYHHLLTIFEGESNSFEQNTTTGVQRNPGMQNIDLRNALADYFEDVNKLLIFATRIRLYLLVPTAFTAFTFIIALTKLIILDRNYFSTFLLTIASIISVVLYIIFSLIGLRREILNSPIVNAVDPARAQRFRRITAVLLRNLEKERRIYRQTGIQRFITRLLPRV